MACCSNATVLAVEECQCTPSQLVCIHIADCRAQHAFILRFDQEDMLDKGHPALLIALARSAAAEHEI